jgi:DNA-binding NarL/FixJ family response regulator
VSTAHALLERDAELERLSDAIEATLGGRGSTVAIEGPAGIGKTALLAGAVKIARARGMRVLVARGGELEREFPYGVVRQFFDTALTAATPRSHKRLVAGAAHLAAPALSPATPNLPAVQDQGAVLHGLYWLSANLAGEQPLLLALDDAHWGDLASLQFVSYLARRVVELPLLIVYAARPREGQGPGLPGEGEPDLVGRRLCPEPLSESATTELIGQLLRGEPSTDFARACHIASGGNPFLVRELVRGVEAEGIAPTTENAHRISGLAPQAISRALLARLRRLGGPATELAFGVAVLGARAELRHAAELAGLEPEAAGEAADGLSAAGILATGRPLEFVHPIVRTTVYAEIPPAKRATSHMRAALLLDRDGAGPDTVAPHLLATEPAGDESVVTRLRVAAKSVLERGAADAGCVYLERACAEPPTPEQRPAVLLELGSAELRAGRPGAVDHLREALDGARDAPGRAVAADELALALAANERFQEAADVLRPVIDELAERDPETALRLEAMHVASTQVGHSPERAYERLARYEGRLHGATPGERLVLAVSAMQSGFRGDPAERVADLAGRALADGRLLAEQRPDSQPFYQAVMVLAFADRLHEAERFLEMAIEDARARGSVFGFKIAACCHAHVLCRMGRIGEAEAEARSAFEAGPQVLPGLQPMVVGYLLEPMLERAEFGGCETLLEESGLSDELPPGPPASILLYNRGHLRLAAGDARRALKDFQTLRRHDMRAGMDNPGLWSGRASAAVAHARLGERDQALTLAHEELAAARRWGAPSAVSFALRAAGIAEAGAAGIVLLRESATVVEDGPARYEKARSLTELGAALRRAGHRRDAREPLREALDLAHRCGARRLAGRAREELLAAGARPRRTALTGLDSLTASQRRVAQFAADGLANREIAQALFVTLRTVEMHLTQAYQKLGIGSREELPVALGDDAAEGDAAHRGRAAVRPGDRLSGD